MYYTTYTLYKKLYITYRTRAPDFWKLPGSCCTRLCEASSVGFSFSLCSFRPGSRLPASMTKTPKSGAPSMQILPSLGPKVSVCVWVCMYVGTYHMCISIYISLSIDTYIAYFRLLGALGNKGPLLRERWGRLCNICIPNFFQPREPAFGTRDALGHWLCPQIMS